MNAVIKVGGKQYYVTEGSQIYVEKLNAEENDVIKLNLDLSNEEALFEDLWKTFFKTVAIKERTNLKCQMNHAPKKYWKNMLEME